MRTIIETLTLHLRDRRAPRTVKAYASIAAGFFSFTRGGCDNPPAMSDIETFLARPLKDGGRRSAATRNQELAALRAFSAFAIRNLGWATDPTDEIPFGREAPHDPPVLSVFELRRLFIEASKLSRRGERSRALAILALLSQLGLRVHELVALDLGQVDAASVTLVGVRGKGGTVHDLPLNSQTIALLGAWTADRVRIAKPGEHALFVSSRGTRLSVRSVEHLIAGLRVRMGSAKHITPHTLRHSAATLALTLGTDLSTVGELLRHADLNTTRRYLHLIDERRREAVRKLAVAIPPELVPVSPEHGAVPRGSEAGENQLDVHHGLAAMSTQGCPIATAPSGPPGYESMHTIQTRIPRALQGAFSDLDGRNGDGSAAQSEVVPKEPDSAHLDDTTTPARSDQRKAHDGVALPLLAVSAFLLALVGVGCPLATNTRVEEIPVTTTSNVVRASPDQPILAGEWTADDSSVTGSLRFLAACKASITHQYKERRFVTTTGIAMGAETSISEQPVQTRLVQGKELVPCGKPTDLNGAKVRIELPEIGIVEGQVDAAGRAKIDLPSFAELDASKPQEVVLRSIPSPDLAFAAGEVVGHVDLSLYMAAVHRRKDALLVEADRQDFGGTVHGDAEARRGFTTQCLPSGKDECFDAIDNDCDGLYDVGCGYRSGALQWTLAWDTGDDLDLHVIGPDGRHVYHAARKGGAAGLELDVDCLGQFGSNCLARNVENIFTPRDRGAMEGTYRAWVEVYRAVQKAEASEAGRVIEATLGGRVAGKTYRIRLRLLAQPGIRVHFAFALGKDRDGDGIIDREDACPDQPGVFSVVATEQGCPDRDLDGVADQSDACPNQPGLRDGDPRKNGCPRSYGHARLTAHGVEIDDAIHFATGKATLAAESLPMLADIARVMREERALTKVIGVEGHTDSEGDDATNMILSRDRVKSVIDHLTLKEGVPADRLLGTYFGETRARFDNATEAGRAQNRRVEFRVLDPEPRAVAAW